MMNSQPSVNQNDDKPSERLPIDLQLRNNLYIVAIVAVPVLLVVVDWFLNFPYDTGDSRFRYQTIGYLGAVIALGGSLWAIFGDFRVDSLMAIKDKRFGSSLRFFGSVLVIYALLIRTAVEA